jgi:magnesium transporter
MAPPQDTEEAGGAGAEQVTPGNDPHFLSLVVGAAGDRDGPLLRRQLSDLHPADLAEIIQNIPEHARETIISLIGPELPPEMLLELDEDLREEVLALLPADYVGKALGQLDTDDAAAVASSVEEDKLEQVLAAAPEDVRIAVESGLSFDEETAGRLMQREFVAAPEFWSVGEAIDHMRAAGDDLPDLFFEIFVVDPSFRPVGIVPLSTVMRTARTLPLRDLMRPPQVLIRPEMDQEEVAFAFQRYNLASAPVVDDAGRLTGMVTVDDIVHVIQEESGEDLLNLSGVSEAALSDTVIRSMRARTPWLMLNLITELTASTVIAMFQDSIDKVVALAVLMPIVASVGGNAGTQTLAVAVRALAARDLTPVNAARFVSREALTGAFNGAAVALALAVVSGLWFHNMGIAVAGGLAVIVNLTCAGLAGSLVPLGLKSLGLDPAVASSVFVTWLTDTLGFLAFLGIATMILFH